MTISINSLGVINVGWFVRPCLLLVVAVWQLAWGGMLVADDAQFETEVRPAIIDRCLRCHGPDKQEGGLRLDTRRAMLTGGESGAAIVPGQADQSAIWQRIAAGEMPPVTEPKLSGRQKEAIRKWLTDGAPMADKPIDAAAARDWRRHWAFQKPDRTRAMNTLPEGVRQQFGQRPALAGVAAVEPNDASVSTKLEVWYRAADLKLADDDDVKLWPDRSGHHRDLVPTRGAHPNGTGSAPRFIGTSLISGQPAVRFSETAGLGSPGSDPLPILGDSAYTICIVLNLKPRTGGYPHDLVVSFGEFGFPGNPGKSLASGLGIRRAVGADHQLSIVGGWGHDALLPPGSFAPLYLRPNIITITKSAGPLATNSRVFFNGQPTAAMPGWGSPSGPDTIPDFQPRQSKDFSVMLGQAVAGAGGILGDIGELLIYSTALDEQQRTGVESHLAQMYGITIPNTLAASATATSKVANEAANPVHPIDAFVDARLREKSLTPAAAAPRETLIRRAYFDLLGLPPTPEQVDKFVNNPSPFAWEAVIVELLSSPQYGERWGRHWLDVARYADSAGFETEEYHRNAWRYRDWVVKAFNDDKPYDRFVQEQLAADEIWPSNMEGSGGYALPARQVANMEAQFGTGLFGLGTRIGESRLDAKLWRYEELTDWVDTTGSAFLGLTVGCARCHDHKFDPLSQQDYFRLQAVFKNTKLVDRPILLDVQHSNWHTDYPNVLRVTAAREAYRLFEQSLAGKTATAEDQAKLTSLREQIGQRVLEVPEAPPGESPFVKRYDGLFEMPCVTVLSHELPTFTKPVRVLNRGDLDRPQAEVSPGFPVALAAATAVSADIPEGLTSRKQLALWLTRPDHPLTSRVMVNRLWQWHFGRGLVATPNDFGRLGQPPSHPELLDYLATELVAQGWSIKSLHRLIMTSAAYQRSSVSASDTVTASDPDNQWLSHFSRRRLEGEAIWDSLHAVAGTLNLQMGGPPVAPPLSAEESGALRYQHQWVVSPDPRQHTRRGVYFVSLRTYRFSLFDVFDAPNNGVSTAVRDVSTVAPQSLWLMNNPRVWVQAQHLAARVVRDTGDNPQALVTKLWRIALGRSPSTDELTEAVALFEQLAKSPTVRPLENAPPELASLTAERASALVTLSAVIFNHNEFLFID